MNDKELNRFASLVFLLEEHGFEHFITHRDENSSHVSHIFKSEEDGAIQLETDDTTTVYWAAGVLLYSGQINADISGCDDECYVEEVFKRFLEE